MRTQKYSGRSTIRRDAGTIFKEALLATHPKGLTNATPIARHAGKVLLSCELCGLNFWRKSCRVKDGSSYCGKGCAYEARRRRVSCTCTVCGQQYITWPCSVKSGRSTCGEASCVLERQRVVAKSRARDDHNVFAAVVAA